jgi:hypothetical protein
MLARVVWLNAGIFHYAWQSTKLLQRDERERERKYTTPGSWCVCEHLMERMLELSGMYIVCNVKEKVLLC